MKFDAAAPPPCFAAEAWDTDRGLPQNSVRAVLQTRDGRIWAGTSDGLACYDGAEFRVYSRANTPGFPDSAITILAEDADGALWIAVRGRGLFRLKEERLIHIAPNAGLPEGRVYALAAAPDGSVWIGTAGGVSRQRVGRFTLFTQAEGLPHNKVNAILPEPDGSVWIGTDRGLRVIRGDTVEAREPAAAPVRALFRAADGARWIATEAALLRLGEGGEFARFGAADGLAPENIEALAEGGDGTLWVGANDGLFRFDGRRFTREAIKGASEREAIQALHRDREDNLWLGTHDGLMRLRRTAFSALGAEEGLTHNVVASVLRDARGALWVGTAGGGLNRLDGGARALFTKADGLFSDGIRALAPARAGGVWVGFDTSGLARIDGERIETFKRRGTFAGSTTNALLEDRRGALWIGRRNGVWTFQDGVFAEPAGAGDLATRNVKALAETPDGAIWIATHTGLLRHRDGVFTAVELAANSTQSLLADGDVLWIGTDGGGLQWLHEGRAHVCTIREGLASDTVFEIIDDGLGFLWMTSRHAIFRVAKAQLLELGRGRRAAVESVAFGKADGLRVGEGSSAAKPGAWRAADGRLWFATVKGVATVDPARLGRNEQPPPVVITRVRAGGADMPVAGPIVVPPGRGELEFAYTALTYAQPQRVAFRYKLEGVNDAWIDAGSRRVASFPRVPPGRHRFLVQASNGDGVWNEAGAAVALRVAPRFHETWWCWLLIAAGLIAAAGGAYALRTRAMRRRERELVGLVGERTAHLQSEIGERRRAEEALRASEALYHSLVEVLPAGIYRKDPAGRFIFANRHHCARLGQPPGGLAGRTEAELRAAELAAAARADEERVLATRAPIHREEIEAAPGGGRRWWDTLTVPVVDGSGAVIGTQGLSWEVTARKFAEQQAEQAHRELLEVSRRAGMAEIATGVLHNVGNVLNSVNVSAGVVSSRVRELRVEGLARVAGLLAACAAGPATAEDSAKKIPAAAGYLAKLTDLLAEDQRAIVAELGRLRANIDHIKAIVGLQQGFAKGAGLVELLPLAEVVEEALRLNGDALARQGVELARTYDDRPVLPLERHQVLQILVNLIENARHACEEAGPPAGRIAVRIACGGGVARVSVADNGVGIAPANLTRIFGHGFTTKPQGHGFGLHSSALAARALGGRLTAHSAGPGQGAEFVLELPLAGAAATRPEALAA